MSKSHGNVVWKLAGLAGVCLVVVIVGSRYLKGARVTGDTPEDRIASVIKLADDRPRGFADALVDTVRNDPDASVRRVALVCLNRSRRPSDRDTIEAATHDDDPRVRRGACRTLMAYPDQETVERLTEIALGDPDEDVRKMAFTALAANDSPHATITLMDLMEHGDDERLRIDAAVAMLDKVNSSAVPNPDDRLAWQEMVAGLKRSSDVRDAYAAAGARLIRDNATERRMDAWHIRSEEGGAMDELSGQRPSREE